MLPCTTGVLGPFGDIVVYSSDRIYLSWYPDYLVGTSTRAEPIRWDEVMARVDTATVAERTIAALSRLCPAVREAAASCHGMAVDGDAIFALARTYINDPSRRLHRRDAPNIQSRGDYHSVDTGKYVLGPLLAEAVADRILPHARRAP